MLVGYARISTHEQSLDLREDTLEKVGSVVAERPGIAEALPSLREGDNAITDILP